MRHVQCSPVAWTKRDARRRLLGLLAPVVALALLTGCSSEPPPEETVEVEGAPFLEPEITYAAPFEITSTESSLVVEGNGPRLESEQPVLLHYRLESAETGELIDQTFGGLPKKYLLTPEEMSLELYEALLGVTVGSRVLLLTQGDEERAVAPTVLVADIVPTEATGSPVETRTDLPVVTVSDDGVPQVEIPDADPPEELEVQTLLRGSGEQVTGESTVVVQYTSVRWRDGLVVDSTWEALGPRSFSVAETITGWNAGLAEQTVGSRVLLVVPPAAGFGDGGDHDLTGETVVYVVDILAATTPQED